jgi:hypothetical protein
VTTLETQLQTNQQIFGSEAPDADQTIQNLKDQASAIVTELDIQDQINQQSIAAVQNAAQVIQNLKGQAMGLRPQLRLSSRTASTSLKSRMIDR